MNTEDIAKIANAFYETLDEIGVSPNDVERLLAKFMKRVKATEQINPAGPEASLAQPPTN